MKRVKNPAKEPSIDLQNAMLAAKFQPSPKLEKIKPMIPEIVDHLEKTGWINKQK